MMFRQENRKYYLFITLATLFLGIAFTSADFFTSPAGDAKGMLTLFFQWGMLVVALCSFVYLLSLNKYIFAVFYPVIALLSAVLTYFRYTTGTILTTMILDAALDNDVSITYELISPGLILSIFAGTSVAILFAYYRIVKIKVKPMGIHAGIALLSFLLLFNIPRIKAPLAERIPFNLYFMTKRYLSEKNEVLTERPPLGKQPHCEESSDLLVLFILGESLRSDHLGFNGYSRNTTPHLSGEDIISFTNIYSEYTYTNASLPHILTRADSISPERGYEERSFIDLYKRCGYYTSWLANQESAKSYIYFMKECDTLVMNNINKSPYVFDKWLDEDMLPSFQHLLKKRETRQLVIMHTIGSHWYYNSHFPDDFQKFNPVTASRIVSSNSAEEMINSYDNTVLYTDYFIFRVMNMIRERNAILIYLSDHAEALGEEGVWLHAVDAPVLHYPACFVWMTEQYKGYHPEKYEKLQSNKDKFYRTDFAFPSLLDAAGIESDVSDKSLSIFR